MVHAEGLPIAIGPCVVTADEVDPQVMYLQVKIDGEEVAKGNLNGTATSLYRTIEEASKLGAARPRRRARAQPVPSAAERQLWPGARSSSRREGIGTLRTRVAAG